MRARVRRTPGGRGIAVIEPSRRTERRPWPARAATAATIGGLLAGEGARLAYDRATRRTGLPATVDDLDASYLGSLLGRRVTEIDVVEGTEGTTDRVRLRLRGDGVPETVFVKMAAATAAIRLFGNLADLGGDEIRFYRDIRPTLDIEVPVVHGLDHDARTKRFVLVLEDLGERGCTFPELVDALDVGQATAGLETLARLHGAHWADPALDRPASAAGGLGWVRANSADRLLPLYGAIIGRFARQLAEAHPDLLAPGGRAILAAYPSVARALDEGRHTILHGDPHPGNWYVDGDHLGLLDWQAIRRGNPLRDVAYFLVLGLDPSDRRQHERALLDGYVDALARHGGPDLVPDRAWDRYRSMAAYPYVAATFTAGFGGLQHDDTALEGLRRAATAIDDLDAPAALGLR